MNRVAFDKMKDKIMNQTSGKQDHYAALRYFLIKTNTVQLFVAEDAYGKTGKKADCPSQHRFCNNMRRLYRHLGWDKLIRFLDFCTIARHNPWIGFVKVFDRFEAEGIDSLAFRGKTMKDFNKSTCAATKTVGLCQRCNKNPAIDTLCIECANGSTTKFIPGTVSVSRFGLWNKVSQTKQKKIKALCKPAGYVAGKYNRYPVYNKNDLYSALRKINPCTTIANGVMKKKV
jgi:hypothetical protein